MAGHNNDIKALDTEGVDTEEFTSWPLVVAAMVSLFSSFVFGI